MGDNITKDLSVKCKILNIVDNIGEYLFDLVVTRNYLNNSQKTHITGEIILD